MVARPRAGRGRIHHEFLGKIIHLQYHIVMFTIFNRVCVVP